MIDELHKVEARWREADAAALDQRVMSMNDWLDHTEDLIAMFSDDDKMVTELQTMAGLIRTRRNDVDQASGALKANLTDTVLLALHTSSGPLA
jgi:hypothetical protein